MRQEQKPELKRYFLDTEFCDPKKMRQPTELISVGLVNEDNREFYGVYKDIDPVWMAMEVPWLKENVLDKLPPVEEWLGQKALQEGVLSVFSESKDVDIYARNGSYDFYLLCRLFGGMGELKQALNERFGIEKVSFRDTNELKRIFGNAVVPPMDPAEEHISICDARQEKVVFDYYQTKAKNLKL